MTIRSRVARLDDFSGELGLALKKLELEAVQGTGSVDEQIDFVRDLSRAAYAQEVRPWRARSLQALGLAVISVVLGLTVPPSILPAALSRPLFLGLLATALLGWVACLVVYFRKKYKESQWLTRQEQHISSAHALLDP